MREPKDMAYELLRHAADILADRVEGADCGPIRLPVCTSDGYVGYRRADSRLGAKARHAKRGAGGAGDAAPPADE